MTESTEKIRSIVPQVSNLLRPLAGGDKQKLNQLVLVHLRSMLKEMSEFKNKDKKALEELRRQIKRLDHLEKY